MCTCCKPHTYCPVISLCPGAFVFQNVSAQILNFVAVVETFVQDSERIGGEKGEVEEQWWRMDDLFCFSCTTKYTIELLARERERETERERGMEKRSAKRDRLLSFQ